MLWLLGGLSIFSFQSWSQSVLTSWDFNNGTIAPAVGSGSAQILGNLNTSYPTAGGLGGMGSLSPFGYSGY